MMTDEAVDVLCTKESELSTNVAPSGTLERRQQIVKVRLTRDKKCERSQTSDKVQSR